MIIQNYWNSVWRNLMKRKGFSFINIFGLAVGMASALLIFTYVAFEFSFDKMHSKSERIYRVQSTFHEGEVLTDDWATSSFGYGSAMQENLAGIEDYTRVGCIIQPEQLVKYGELCLRENGIAYADPGFFRLFDFELLKGDRASCLSMPCQVVITERIARKYFRDEDPVGKILIFNSNMGKVSCEVTGIMKEINMTKAISCMPDKFITMEMVELAATEHRPELVNYLPEKYITSEILDSIFKTDDYGWRSWQLSKIPEEKRNRQICLRAIKAEKSNFPDIPEKYRNSDILESLFAHRNFMHYLHLIPLSSWNNGTVRDAIYSLYRDVQQNGGYRYCSERYEQQFLYETSVMLSFVPRQAKDFRLWKEVIFRICLKRKREKVPAAI